MITSQFEVLRYIAENGPNIKYQIEVNLGKDRRSRRLSHGSVTNAVNELCKQGFIAIVKEETARTGLPQLTYGLTLLGLCMLYAEHQEEIIMSKLIKNWSSLSLLLQKWDVLEMKFGKQFLDMFNVVARSFRIQSWRRTHLDSHEVLREFLTLIVHGFPEDSVPWLQTLRGDSEFRPVVIQIFQEEIERSRKAIQRQRKILAMVASVDEPNWLREVHELLQFDELQIC